jgi:hypothetical protein
MTRPEFEASVRAAAVYGPADRAGSWLLTEEQFAAIFAAADQYAAHLIEKTMRPQWRPLNGAK